MIRPSAFKRSCPLVSIVLSRVDCDVERSTNDILYTYLSSLLHVCLKRYIALLFSLSLSFSLIILLIIGDFMSLLKHALF